MGCFDSLTSSFNDAAAYYLNKQFVDLMDFQEVWDSSEEMEKELESEETSKWNFLSST